MDVNQLTYEIRGAIFEVFTILGPGLLESYYEHALCREPESRGLSIQKQVAIPGTYKGAPIDIGFRIDILVEDLVIIEIKSADVLHDVHKKQLLTYLRLTNEKLGILVNFNVARIEDKISLIRIIN